MAPSSGPPDGVPDFTNMTERSVLAGLSWMRRQYNPNFAALDTTVIDGVFSYLDTSAGFVWAPPAMTVEDSIEDDSIEAQDGAAGFPLPLVNNSRSDDGTVDSPGSTAETRTFTPPTHIPTSATPQAPKVGVRAHDPTKKKPIKRQKSSAKLGAAALRPSYPKKSLLAQSSGRQSGLRSSKSKATLGKEGPEEESSEEQSSGEEGDDNGSGAAEITKKQSQGQELGQWRGAEEESEDEERNTQASKLEREHGDGSEGHNKMSPESDGLSTGAHSFGVDDLPWGERPTPPEPLEDVRYRDEDDPIWHETWPGEGVTWFNCDSCGDRIPIFDQIVEDGLTYCWTCKNTPYDRSMVEIWCPRCQAAVPESSFGGVDETVGERHPLCLMCRGLAQDSERSGGKRAHTEREVSEHLYKRHKAAPGGNEPTPIGAEHAPLDHLSTDESELTGGIVRPHVNVSPSQTDERFLNDDSTTSKPPPSPTNAANSLSGSRNDVDGDPNKIKKPVSNFRHVLDQDYTTDEDETDIVVNAADVSKGQSALDVSADASQGQRALDASADASQGQRALDASADAPEGQSALNAITDLPTAGTDEPEIEDGNVVSTISPLKPSQEYRITALLDLDNTSTSVMKFAKITVDGVELKVDNNEEIQAAWVDLIADTYKKAEACASANSTEDDQIGELNEILLKDADVWDEFVRQDFDENVNVATAVLKNHMKAGMKANIVESFFSDMVEKKVMALSAGHERSQQQLIIARELYQALPTTRGSRGKDSTGKDSTVAEYQRLWAVLRNLRYEHHLIMIAVLHDGLKRLIRKSRVTLDMLLAWSPMIARLFKQHFARLTERRRGDHRGRSELPARLVFLGPIWSVTTGRWGSPNDVISFYDDYGAPLPGDEFLATESQFDCGFGGYDDKNGTQDVVLVNAIIQERGRSDHRWCAITTKQQLSGTVFGVCPHIMSNTQDPEFPGAHILNAYDSMNYDPTKVLGTLSFVNYTTNQNLANVCLAADLYCDPIYPHYYSFRIQVVATKDIRPFEKLHVFVQDAEQAAHLAKAVTERVEQLKRSELFRAIPSPDSYAYRMPRLASLLLKMVQSDHSQDAEGLDPRQLIDIVWTPFLACGSDEYVPVSAAEHRHLQPLTESLSQDAVDYNQLDWVQDFKASQDAVHKAAAMNASYGEDVRQLSSYQFAVVAMKCISLLPREKNKPRKDPIISTFQMDPKPQHPAVRPKCLQQDLNDGIAPVALYLLFTIEPLRNIFSTFWGNKWSAATWKSSIASVSQQGMNYALTDKVAMLLEQLGTTMKRMNGPERCFVDRSIWAGLPATLQEVLCLLGLEKDSEPVTATNLPSKVFSSLHRVLEDCLRDEPDFIEPEELPETDAASRAYNVVQTAWRSESERLQNSFLLSKTIGMSVELNEEDSVPSAPLLHSSVALVIPDDQQLAYDLQEMLLRSLMNSTSGGNRRKFAVLPEYILAEVQRNQSGEQSSPVRLVFPQAMQVNLAGIATPWEGIGKPSQVSGYRYDIAAAVFRISMSSPPEEPDSLVEYMTYVKDDQTWCFFRGNQCGITSSERVRNNTSELHMLVLRRV